MQVINIFLSLSIFVQTDTGSTVHRRLLALLEKPFYLFFKIHDCSQIRAVKQNL